MKCRSAHLFNFLQHVLEVVARLMEIGQHCLLFVGGRNVKLGQNRVGFFKGSELRQTNANSIPNRSQLSSVSQQT